MAVDSATTIAAFDTAKPAGGDPLAESDNNHRHIKTVVKDCFPNIAGAVTVTHTQLNTVPDLAPKASPTFTGTPLAPTAAALTSTTQIATTAFVQTAIAAVNAQTAMTVSIDSAASFSITAGQFKVATNVAAVAATAPASPSTGNQIGLICDNGLYTNTLDLGANSMTHNGVTKTGVITLNVRMPLRLTWCGDYWRVI